MKPALIVILIAVALDSMGVGLVLPILPALLRELAHTTQIAEHYGALIAAYALAQFVCSPVLGMLADRYGRRPVLLISLAGAVLDYLVMAVAPVLWLFYVSRIIAGITGANIAVATAYVTDITPEPERAKRFGWMNACFGLGFIAGPVLGGLLGAQSLRYPFIAAAGLCAINFMLGLFVLPESQPRHTSKLTLKGLNPFASLRAIFQLRGLALLMVIFFLVQTVAQVGAVLWVIYGQDRFGWDPAMVGLSLAAFGLVHAASQTLVTGPLIARLGERGALMLATAVDAVGYCLLGLATKGWMALALIPLLCIGGIEAPALQALLTRLTPKDRQGELQGALASMGSIAGVIAPLGVAALYAATAQRFPGLVWILSAGIYLLCIPLLISWRRRHADTV